MRGSLQLLLACILGCGLGTGVGWFAWGPAAAAGKAAAPAEGTRTAAEPRLEGRPGSPTTDARTPPSGDPAVPSPLAEALRTASPRRILEAFGTPPSPAVPDDAVLVLVRRLEESVRTGDKPLFDATASVLSRTKHAEVVATLVRLTMDERVDLPADAGRWFVPVLTASRAPGLAASARRRFEEAARSGRSWLTDAWLDVVARAGDAGDVAWVLEQPGRRGGLQAVARSSNPAAVERFRSMFETDPRAAEVLAAHVDATPDGWAWAIEVARHATSGRTRLPREVLRALLTVVAREAPEDEVATVKDLLLGIRDGGQRLQALYAVDELARRGVDVADLDALVQAPGSGLEAIARGPDRTWDGLGADELIYVIEYARVTWTEESARALDAVAALPEHAARARQLSERIRAALASHWKGG